MRRLPDDVRLVGDKALFDHGLLGEGAPDAGFIGVQMPAGDYGDNSNLKLRFDPTYMQMAADGAL